MSYITCFVSIICILGAKIFQASLAFFSCATVFIIFVCLFVLYSTFAGLLQAGLHFHFPPTAMILCESGSTAQAVTLLNSVVARGATGCPLMPWQPDRWAQSGHTVALMDTITWGKR